MSESELIELRHSLAHILASAVQRLWPKAQFGVGPTTEDGFYYDIKIPDHALTESDLSKIESVMNELIKADLPFEQFNLPIDEAIKWAKDNHQPYKEELLNDLKRSGTTSAKDLTPEEMGTLSADKAKVDTVSFYKDGDFVDLCRGPHLASTGKAAHFKLMRISGAYWRGDTTKDQLQRIYGIACLTSNELKDYLNGMLQAKERDHRRLGQELDLFVLSDLIGPGLP
ncbi:MAG: threonine--tRNA ligase, partial [Candidatus Saccharimonadales bacterium]